MADSQEKYTQREWDREVGLGTVPEEYAHVRSSKEDIKQSTAVKLVSRLLKPQWDDYD